MLEGKEETRRGGELNSGTWTINKGPHRNSRKMLLNVTCVRLLRLELCRTNGTLEDIVWVSSRLCYFFLICCLFLLCPFCFQRFVVRTVVLGHVTIQLIRSPEDLLAKVATQAALTVLVCVSNHVEHALEGTQTDHTANVLGIEKFKKRIIIRVKQDKLEHFLKVSLESKN